MDSLLLQPRQAASEVTPPLYTAVYGHVAPHATSCVVVLTVFLVLTLLFTGARLYSRSMTPRRLMLTDYMFLIAQVFYIVYIGLAFASLTQGGIGYHVQELGLAQIQTILKLLLAVQIVYAVCMCLLKVSICLLYVQVFPQKWVKVSSYALMGLSAAWALMTILIGVLICKPISALWDPATGTCGNQNAGLAAVSGIELVIDAMIIALPLPIVWRLQTSISTKLATSALFCLGAITIVVTGVRIKVVLGVDFLDFSYTSVDVFNYTVAELGIAVIVTSGLALRPLLDRFFSFPRWRSYLSSRNRTQDMNSKSGYGMHTIGGASTRSHAFKSLSDAGDRDDESHLTQSRGFTPEKLEGEWPLHMGESSLRGQGIVVTRDIDVKHETV